MDCIFQYMITGPECDARGPIPEVPDMTRSEVYRQCGDLSAYSFMKYAKKIGCDHHYSTKQVFTKGVSGGTVLLFEVLRIIYDPLYDKYDNVLFCDTDIICNTEENIFDVHRESGKDISGVLESEFLLGDIEETDAGLFRKGSYGCVDPSVYHDLKMKQQAKNKGYNTWDFAEDNWHKMQNKFRRLGYKITPVEEEGLVPSRQLIMNTGVMVWSKEARLRARKEFYPWEAYMKDGDEARDDFWLNNDQPYISAMIGMLGFTINHLNQTWNDSPPHYQKYESWKDQNFLHYTGGFGKKELLDAKKKGLFKFV